jgi:hypothetical protein
VAPEFSSIAHKLEKSDHNSRNKAAAWANIELLFEDKGPRDALQNCSQAQSIEKKLAVKLLPHPFLRL